MFRVFTRWLEKGRKAWDIWVRFSSSLTHTHDVRDVFTCDSLTCVPVYVCCCCFFPSYRLLSFDTYKCIKSTTRNVTRTRGAVMFVLALDFMRLLLLLFVHIFFTFFGSAIPYIVVCDFHCCEKQRTIHFPIQTATYSNISGTLKFRRARKS